MRAIIQQDPITPDVEDQPTTTQPVCVKPSSLNGSDPYPAFFAQRSAPLTTAQDSGDIVVTYDQVTVNLAGGFSGQSGIFTAPIRGFYYFSFSAGYSQINVKIVKNLKEIITSALVNQDFCQLNYSCSFPAHAEATILLEVGDQVWIQLSDSASYLHATDVQTMNNTLSFTGFLLYSLNKVIYRLFISSI